MEYLLTLDRKVFLWINSQWANPYLDFFFSTITWLGNGWIIVALVFIFFAMKRRVYLRRHLPWLIVALFLSGLCIFLLKKIAPRPRPLSDFGPLIEAGKVQIHIVGERLRYGSFPSGHTQTAFAAGTYLSLLFPRWSLLFLSLAGGVGLSRIYMGAHFPLDVIMGGLVGIVFAWVTWSVRNKFQKHPSHSNIDLNAV
ncbi:MAG: phosphatase PAP2 family protein [Deltaproteobacteria bacterium]|nr:MAG: phosphatase PAP2 family protein [Deltaproteobacteria bacterium]